MSGDIVSQTPRTPRAPDAREHPAEGPRMQALVLEPDQELNLRDIDIPEQLGPRDARIRLHTVGICGSDVHYYTHGRIGPFVVNELTDDWGADILFECSGSTRVAETVFKPLITDSFSFDESVKAFDYCVNMPPSNVKAQIQMQ